MAYQTGHPSNPGNVGSTDWSDSPEMKAEAACQTIDNGGPSGIFNDSSINDLFTSLTEMKMSLHKVEAQNRKLKESRSQMQSQLEVHEKNSLACKEKLHKTAEQLSCVFQENCRLNEENARLKIDNQNLMKQLDVQKKKISEQLELITKQPHDFCETCPKKKLVPPAALANLDFSPELSRSMPEDLKQSGSTPMNSPAVKKLKGLEKRHSSPQFFPNNESVEEISEKLLAQLMQEKHELEQQYNQMVEIQRVSDVRASTPLVSDFSLLDVEVPEEDEQLLKHVEKCAQRMIDVKRDIGFMNYTLKYLLYFATVQQKQEGNKPKTSPNNVETQQQLVKQPDTKSFSSAPRTLVDSLESTVDTPCVPRKDGPTKSVPPVHRPKSEDKIPWNSVHPPPLSPSPLNTRGVQHMATSGGVQNPNLPEREWNKPVADILPVSKDALSEHRRTCWPPTSVYIGGVNISPKHPTEASPVFVPSSSPLVMRSESAEANAGSPPPSFGLTPDSLLPSSSLHCDGGGQLFSRSPELSNKEEDRICPMCSAVFPCPIPQDQFETHVVNHFELEEFELLNI